MEIQSGDSLEEVSHFLPSVEFYKSISVQCCPRLRTRYQIIFFFLDSTYFCEQVCFSCVKIDKSKNRSMVSDANINAVMRV